MRHAVFDVETNGLLDEMDRIHCLAIRDFETDEVVSCADQKGYVPIREGLTILRDAEIVFGHNVIAFDIPALQKVYPKWETKARVFDTLVAARLRWAHIKDTDYRLQAKGQLPGNLIGRHTLEAWGYRMGILKGKYADTTDWSAWDPEMQRYCERDTLVTRELILRLKKAGYDRQSMDNEQALAWFLAQMERNGWPLDVPAAESLASLLGGKREVVAQRLREVFGQFFVRDGKPWRPKKDNAKRGLYAGFEVQKLKLVDFNPASRDHIANRLIRKYGWKPTAFTPGGKPEVDDGAIKGLPYPEVPDLLEYLLHDKRLGQCSEGNEAWLKTCNSKRPQGGVITGLPHIHAYVNSGGTVTHRASHSHPNIAQVPKVGKPYGTECRSLFIVPDGWELMGSDMSGLELRCLAHYMARYDNMAYGQTILLGSNEDGTDIHSVNMRVLGFEGKLGRDKAKTWFYAYLYGAGDAKLGWIADPSLTEAQAKALGAKLRKKFEGGLPALGYLIDALKQKLKDTAPHSHINLIDGRRAYVRSDHAVLNTLLQGTGAVLCKHWIVEFNERMVAKYGPQGWDQQWAAVGWIHDEIQIAVRRGLGVDVGAIAVASAEAMTVKFAFRCPLTGEAKVGLNWADTH